MLFLDSRRVSASANQARFEVCASITPYVCCEKEIRPVLRARLFQTGSYRDSGGEGGIRTISRR